MLERRYCVRKLPADSLAWREHERKRHAVYRKKKPVLVIATFGASRPAAEDVDYQFLNSRKSRQWRKWCHIWTDCTEPAELFQQQDRQGAPVQFSLPLATAFLDSYHIYASDDIGIISMTAASKSCQLDPLPTFIRKDSLRELLPYITDTSPEDGRLPISQRHAIVQTRLKRATVDPGDMKNYSSITNLTFMSKISEKIVKSPPSW